MRRSSYSWIRSRDNRDFKSKNRSRSLNNLPQMPGERSKASLSSALALAEDLERWLKHEPIQARRTGIFTRGRNGCSAIQPARSCSVSVALAAAAGWIVWKSEFIRQPVTTGIAVLPFENLSEQKERRGLCRWRAGRHSDEAGENRRSEGDQPDQRDGLSRQAEYASDRQRAASIPCAGGKRSEERCPASYEYAVDRHAHGHAHLGRTIRALFE